MKVKQLEWNCPFNDDYWEARIMPDCKYAIEWDLGLFVIELYFETNNDEFCLDVLDGRECNTLEEAKAVCQKHYERLILSALVVEDES